MNVEQSCSTYNLARPLTWLATSSIIRVALPTNAEGRNGQFRDGGHYSPGWVDAYTSQTPKRPHVSLCFQASWVKKGRALCRITQQSWRNVYRTVQNATTRQNIEVSSASSAGAYQFPGRKPQRLPRRSIESRHANFMPYGNNWQGRVGRECTMLAIYRGRFYLLRPSKQPRCQCGKPATYHTNDIYFCGRCLGRILLTLQHYTIDTKSRGGEA